MALLLVVHVNPNPYDEDRIRIIGARRPPAVRGRSTKKALSRAGLDQLAKIAALPDDQIDTTDIPEAPVENWTLARRGDFYRPLKRSVTIRLDADVLAWLKDHAGGGRYQTEINRILRRHVIEAERTARERRAGS